MSEIARADVGESVSDGDTSHLNAIFGNIRGYKARIADLEAQLAEKTQLLEKAEKENAWLRGDLQAHQRGERIQIVIEGRTFSANLDGPAALQPSVKHVTITDDWLTSQQTTERNLLDNSFLLDQK